MARARERQRKHYRDLCWCCFCCYSARLLLLCSVAVSHTVWASNKSVLQWAKLSAVASVYVKPLLEWVSEYTVRTYPTPVV